MDSPFFLPPFVSLLTPHVTAPHCLRGCVVFMEYSCCAHWHTGRGLGCPIEADGSCALPQEPKSHSSAKLGGNGGKWGEVGGSGGKWGEMGGSGGKWGGKWGALGGNGESSTDQVGKCRNNSQSGRQLGKAERLMGGKMGRKYPFFTVPFSPISRSSICKNQASAVTNGKME